MANFNVYNKLTVAAPCYRLINPKNQQIYDGNAGAFAAPGSVTLANSLVDLTLNATHVFTPVTLPSGLEAGEYDFLAYNEASGSVTTSSIPAICTRIKVLPGGAVLISETL